MIKTINMIDVFCSIEDQPEGKCRGVRWSCLNEGCSVLRLVSGDVFVRELHVRYASLPNHIELFCRKPLCPQTISAYALEIKYGQEVTLETQQALASRLESKLVKEFVAVSANTVNLSITVELIESAPWTSTFFIRVPINVVIPGPPYRFAADIAAQFTSAHPYSLTTRVLARSPDITAMQKQSSVISLLMAANLHQKVEALTAKCLATNITEAAIRQYLGVGPCLEKDSLRYMLWLQYRQEVPAKQKQSTFQPKRKNTRTSKSRAEKLRVAPLQYYDMLGARRAVAKWLVNVEDNIRKRSVIVRNKTLPSLEFNDQDDINSIVTRLQSHVLTWAHEYQDPQIASRYLESIGSLHINEQDYFLFYFLIPTNNYELLRTDTPYFELSNSCIAKIGLGCMEGGSTHSNVTIGIPCHLNPRLSEEFRTRAYLPYFHQLLNNMDPRDNDEVLKYYDNQLSQLNLELEKLYA